MSNSGLECVGSCLQCCSEYQRGEARQGTPPPLLTYPTGRAPGTAALARNPGGLVTLARQRRHQPPHPPGWGRLPGSRPSCCSAHLCPLPSWHTRWNQLPRAVPAGARLVPDGRNDACYSILKPAGRTDRTPALLSGQKRHLGDSSPARGTLSFAQLLSAVTTCCGHALKHRGVFF